DCGMAGIEDILKEQNLLAAQAISGKPTNTEDWLEGISAQIEKIIEQQRSLGQIIRDAVRDGITGTVYEVGSSVAKSIEGGVKLVTGAVDRARGLETVGGVGTLKRPR